VCVSTRASRVTRIINTSSVVVYASGSQRSRDRETNSPRGPRGRTGQKNVRKRKPNPPAVGRGPYWSCRTNDFAAGRHTRKNNVSDGHPERRLRKYGERGVRWDFIAQRVDDGTESESFACTRSAAKQSTLALFSQLKRINDRYVRFLYFQTIFSRFTWIR